jgi:hypothetical protein
MCHLNNYGSCQTAPPPHTHTPTLFKSVALNSKDYKYYVSQKNESNPTAGVHLQKGKY